MPLERAKVLLTGSTGFLGSKLAAQLVAHGCDVIALVRPNSNLRRIEPIRTQLTFFEHDGGQVNEVFEQHQDITVILHAATCYGKRGESSSSIHAANIALPMKLLETGLKSDVRVFCNADTFFPDDFNLYAETKKTFLRKGSQQAAKGGMRFANLRIHHMYGPWDDDTKFASFVIRKCASNEKVLRLTAGTQKRDFVYVDDVADAFLRVLPTMRNIPPGEFREFDIGCGKAVSVRTFVETAQRITRSITRLEFGALPLAANEILTAQANTAAIRSTGWEPRFDLETGIRAIVIAEGL